jgi:hypothetical protein
VWTDVLVPTANCKVVEEVLVVSCEVLEEVLDAVLLTGCKATAAVLEAEFVVTSMPTCSLGNGSLL